MAKAKPNTTDFNDLHCAEGLKVVGEQLRAAYDAFLKSPAPPDKGDEKFSDSPPAPSDTGLLSLEKALEKFSFYYPKNKVFDETERQLVSMAAFKLLVAPEVFKAWSEKKRSVGDAYIKPKLAAAKMAGGAGLVAALKRYVYLMPSDEVYDTETREIIKIAHLRFAIADCFDDWLKHVKRREIPRKNLVFDPTMQVGKGFINKFAGLPLQAKTPPDNLEPCLNMVKLLKVLCNYDDEAFLWLRRWLAFPLIHVGKKMRTAVLMHSDVHGTGKSLFFDGVMRPLYGQYARTLGQVDLESQYNDWMSEALFGVFEEVLSRSQKFSHTGTVKQMVTGPVFRVNKKFMSGWEESNHMNSVFLSNEFQPLPIEPHDRRFLIIWPEIKLLQEIKEGVNRELAEGGSEYFLGWLRATPLEGFNEFTEPPITDAKMRLIEFGRPAWEVFYGEWKNNELDLPYTPCLVSQLYTAFKRWCNRQGEHAMSQNKFSGLIQTKERLRKDLHYQVGTGDQTKKGRFFMVEPCPPSLKQQVWLGGRVEECDRKLGNAVDDL
ncbi:hypothetical protein TDB9533_01247 [Thalassocella blandensis]|nr:hypothetical protein TDB9533_01247 [Thalassocella blandensis]